VFDSSLYTIGEFEMPIIMGNNVEREGIMQGAKLMLISARTAPKSGGEDDLLTALAVILIGVQGTKPFGLDCGACGYSDCLAFERAEHTAGNDFVGPNCIFKALDLGIALGSAVKMASSLNLDNRIMYTIGTAAKRLNMLPNASIIMGIPIAATGKNIFFDRS
jgi:uncharacterized ferredoxin-like protein